MSPLLRSNEKRNGLRRPRAQISSIPRPRPAVVGRDRVVAQRIGRKGVRAIGIEAEHLAEKLIRILPAAGGRVAAAAAVAEGHVEKAVGSELEVAAVVVAVGVRDDEEDLARAEGEEIGVAGVPRVALDDDVAIGDPAGAVPVAAGVVEVDEAVRQRAGVNSHRQQAALAAVVHFALRLRDAWGRHAGPASASRDARRTAVPDPNLARLGAISRCGRLSGGSTKATGRHSTSQR
jgi:hypothetical protein